MPTHDEDARFWSDWRSLSDEQRALFLAAVQEMLEDLRARRPFRKSLRVKRFHSRAGVYEMSWSGDGRALFAYGVSPHPGDIHITWLRIGTHDIYQNP